MPDSPAPPTVAARPVELTLHDDTRIDPWFWLRHRDDPDVIGYLEAENAYTSAALDHTKRLQDELFDEIKARVQETDVSAPVRFGPWDYFVRTFEGRQYAQHGRRPAGVAPGDGEVVLLDENVLAGDSPYFALGGFAIAPSHDVFAYSTDYSGGERHTLRFRDARTGEDLPDEVEDVYYGLAWCDDSRTILYVRPDDTVRPFQIWRHTLGTDPATDALVHQEDDERFFIGVSRSRSGRYLFIASDSKITSEVHFLPSDDPTATPRVVEARTVGMEYAVEHHVDAEHGDRFFVLTNADDASDFKIMETPVATPGRDHWVDVVPHRSGTRVHDFDAFAAHLLVSERGGGLEQLRVRELGTGDEHVIEMPETVHTVWAGENPEYDSSVLRYGYTSLVRPTSAFDYDLATRSSTLVKETPVLGGYDADRFTSARLWATAPDNTLVPLSVVHRKDVPLDGTAPALLYGYGSYEYPVDPTFSSIRLSLLERGFVFAIAHIRGGGELGRHWYEDGKLLHKRNTFSDFIACAEHLIAEGYTSSDRLGARGGSAGGLLMGATMVQRPDLFRAVVAEVPFVDVVTTMLDPSIPLTVTEWEEWGNPNEADFYRYMKSYSPYDNVTATEYPALFVTAGLNDPRVAYWEPAKFVAKLRATKTDDRLLVLKTEMGAGHGGPSGRYDAWRDEALVLAFLLDQLTGDDR